jgi:dihydrofolate reductase
MILSFLVAHDKNRVIGNNGRLPWKLPRDLQYFQDKTMNGVVIMGRKTYESLPTSVRPLKNRVNIILTKNVDYKQDGCVVLHSRDELFEYFRKNPAEKAFVIGGSEIFKELMNDADEMTITEIHHEFEGDTFFPEKCEDEWRLLSSVKGIFNSENPYDYYFTTYTRKKGKR